MVNIHSDLIFIILIMSINTLVWVIMVLPSNRQRFFSIYLITRSWWWMLAVLFGCYLLSQAKFIFIDSPNSHNNAWVLDGLFLFIGGRAWYEVLRLQSVAGKTSLLQKLATIKTSQTTALKKPLNQSIKQINFSAISQFSWLDAIILVAITILVVALISLNHLTLAKDMHGILLFVMFASQFNDIAQYLCGRWFGGKLFARKLAPIISPNKTIEGALFGSLLSASLATLLGLLLTPFDALACFIVAYGLAVTGILGDLLESAFKRHHGIKDTGTMLAGHGGVLDRIDSLLIGVPLFTVIFWMFFN